MSKGLEALEKILNQELVKSGKYRKTIRDIASVGQVITIHKELKALEIIKKKNFDLFYLQDSKDLEMYNDACDHFRNLCYLTQEEYNLLKEVLC